MSIGRVLESGKTGKIVSNITFLYKGKIVSISMFRFNIFESKFPDKFLQDDACYHVVSPLPIT